MGNLSSQIFVFRGLVSYLAASSHVAKTNITLNIKKNVDNIAYVAQIIK